MQQIIAFLNKIPSVKMESKKNIFQKTSLLKLKHKMILKLTFLEELL